MPNSDRPLRKVQVYDLADNFRYQKYYYESFKGAGKPFLYTVSATGIPAVGTSAAGQGVTHSMLTPGGFHWDVFNTTDQAVLPFTTAGTGLDVSCDLVENEAVELVPGGNSSASRLAFVIGTDSDFFMRTKWKITDVSGADQAIFAGFRKQETFAVPTSILTTGDGVYTDFCGIGLSEEDGVDVKVMYDLNNGGSTTVKDTGFDLTDSEVVEFTMQVRGRSAYFLINGKRIGSPVAYDGDGTAITSQATVSTADGAFTFDSGDTVIPFIFLRHDDEVMNAACLQEIEIGHLVDIGSDPDQE
jgi:hypothetical protein